MNPDLELRHAVPVIDGTFLMLLKTRSCKPWGSLTMREAEQMITIAKVAKIAEAALTECGLGHGVLETVVGEGAVAEALLGPCNVQI